MMRLYELVLPQLVAKVHRSSSIPRLGKAENEDNRSRKELCHAVSFTFVKSDEEITMLTCSRPNFSSLLTPPQTRLSLACTPSLSLLSR